MAHGYTYERVRNQFYTFTATQSAKESVLVGEMTQEDAVEELLLNAERELAMMLFPAYKEGRVPSLSALETKKSYQQSLVGAGLTEFQLPPDDSDTNVFHEWLHGWVVGYDVGGYPTDEMKTSIQIVPATDFPKIEVNPFYYPQIAHHYGEYLPAYIQNEKLIFFRAPWTLASVAQPNIHILYYRLPKAPTGTYSDMPAGMAQATVLLMLMQYFGVDASDENLALAQAHERGFGRLFTSVIQMLGFNPMAGGDK